MMMMSMTVDSAASFCGASGPRAVEGRRRSHNGGRSFRGGVTQGLVGGLRSSAICRNMDSGSSSLRAPDPVRSSWEQSYHPFEEMGESPALENGDDARLTNEEAARTVIEVNSKATLMFSGLITDEVHENIIWSNLAYLTDEYGDIYFEVKDDEDIMQTLIADDKLVQVIIGLDNSEDTDLSMPSNFDIGIEDSTDEESDIDDEYDEDMDSSLEDEEDEMISSEASSYWANLETLSSSHPMDFASKIAEVVSRIHLDWMEQPSASIVVQGHLRHAFAEEHTFVRKETLRSNTNGDEKPDLGELVEGNTEGLDKDQSPYIGTAFYKLELVNIQLVSAYGNQAVVEIEDFRNARPDIIAHSAMNIISRLKAGGEMTTQALKSLCWRHKGIRVEEAAISGVDSLGFDLRVCSGTQVQTLRFAFKMRATSEVSAEKQLRDLLFPRLQQRESKPQQARPKEG